MKKRKGEVVGQEGNILKKAKVSDFTEAEENNNNKHIQLVRTVKVLLQKEQTRLSGLSKLRDALKESQNKERLTSIVQEGGEFHEVFKILEGGRHSLSQLEIQTCLEILESVLLFTAGDKQLSTRIGMAIVQQVLQNHMKLLYTCLHPGNPPDVIMTTLRLLTAMITQGVTAAREVQRSFDFTLKAIGALPNKRDPKSPQDVRTCFIYFCLSFLMFGDLAVMKQILEVKGFFQSIMKGLSSDVPPVVHVVLSTLQTRVVQSTGISKKTKVQFFNSFVLTQLAKLYQYAKDSEEEKEQSIRQAVHGILLKICGSFKFGICFTNTSGAFATKTNNPVLLRFLQNLSSSMVSDVLVQELVIKVLCCCQDIVKPFLSSLTVTYEPRLSLPWVSNVNLLTKIYMALPQPSQMIEKTILKISARVMPSLINVVIPPGISRTVLNRGVQHASSLVKHTTLSLLVVILDRAQNTAECLAFKNGTAVDHEQTETTLLQQFREEVFKALPDVKTVISLRQNLVVGNSNEDVEKDVTSPTILLAQTLKVIHGFQTLWPSVFSHMDFDLKKLLPGQQEINFPPIAQQLTLQILLETPAGSLKWYQQVTLFRETPKAKSSTSFVYSILSLYSSTQSESIKNKAKELLWKLLNESGLVDSHTYEVDAWLIQLRENQTYYGQADSLLRFLDEVFCSVAAEPYEYTDIVIEMQAQAAAAEASVAQTGVESSQWNMSDTRLPVSLLLIGAFKRYSELLCKMNKRDDQTAASNIGGVARYMNCLVFEMIHISANPAILCFAVCHYYTDMVVADHLNAIRSLHVALLQYVSNWLPGAVQMQDSIGCAQENLQKLQRFLNSTAVDSEQEKRAAARELYCLLEALNEAQFITVIVDCVEFCKDQLSANFSPLGQVLPVKNYKITGFVTTESLAPLLRVLPFSSLLWQVLSETARDEITLSDELPSNTSCTGNDSSSLLYDSWFQNVLMATLKKEPMSKSIPLCRYLLLHLHLLKSKLLTVAVSVKQDNLQAAMLLCFELLQSLIERLVEIRENSLKTDENALDGNSDDFSHGSDITHTVPETHDMGLSDMEYIIRTVFHHPVTLSCFLWYPEQSLPRTSLQDVAVQLTYHVSNLLLAILPSLTWQQKRILMAPFVKKLISAGMSEIQSAQDGNETPSSQTFYLLGLFHSYCDKEEQVKFISSLCKLPPSLLLAIDSSSKERTPTAFLLTLLKFLEGTSPYEDGDSHPSFTLCKDVILEREEPLSVSHFMQLVKISKDVNCPQLDSIILKLLQASLKYVQASTATVLNSCLLYPTEVKVSIASYLVTHSPALRSHFELCCLSRSNSRKKVKGSNNSSVVSIEFKDHLREFVPLVSSYLLSVRGVTGNGKTRTRAVISHLVEAYWDPLWGWLVNNREGIFQASEEPCMELIITLVHRMEKRADILRMKFNDLLTKASQWDRYQLRICYQLFMCLCRDCPTNEETADFRSKYCFACMEYLSSSFNGKGSTKDTENAFDDALAHLESICKNSDAYIAHDKSCDSVWNSFVTNCLRYKFESAKVLTTLRCLIKAMYRKEPYDKKQSDTLLPLDTLYEMLISHSQFLDVILSDGPSGNKDAKESLTELMVTIVDLRPSCCKSSHLPVLFAAYSASLSVTDQCILYLMSLYEKNHASFKDYRPFLWGPAAASHHQVSRSLGPSLWQQPSVTEVLELLDAKKMSQSTVLFSQTRLLQPQVHRKVSQEKPQDVYDPCFLLPLFSCIVAPNYQVDCRKFVEQGCLSFTVASLSSRDTHVRQAGYHVLSRFMTHLEGSRFKERKQIFHLLKCLQNGITEANYRISSLMTCFVARVAYILLRPEHPFYLMMNNFLLQRPALDIRDLPLFYSMFNSSTMQHVSERSWMLQLLVDGMKDSPDYYLYKRRHVIELALSYHDSPVSDQRSQNLVTELLQSTLKIHPAAYDLAKNFSIVAWIHSLCYKSAERLCTSLRLLHTLWFTLYRGSLEKKNESVEGNSGKELRQEWKAVRLPPNVAQECALVCWTMLENLRSRHNTSDTSTYLDLLASITNYLATTEQSFGLSRDRVVSLLCLWSASFDETMFLNQLLSSLKFSQGWDSSSSKNSPRVDSEYRKAKTDSLSSLLTILTKWKPSPGEGGNQTVLLVWWFGLACSAKSYIDQETDNVCFQSDNNDTEHRLLSVLRWFRKCILRDRELQDHLTHNPTTGKTLILQLYHVVLSHNKAGLLQSTEGRRISSYELINEVNVICLVLFAAVQRILKQNTGIPTSSQPAIFQLVSQEPYSNIISEGLEKVILPLLPDPRGEMEQGSCLPEQDCVLLDLVYLFMQEFWTERPIPRQFLSFLLSHSDTGCPVVDSLVLALGGTKVIKKWAQKQGV